MITSRVALASIGLVLAFFSASNAADEPSGPQARQFKERWVYAKANLAEKDGLDAALADLKTYKDNGVTHLLMVELRLARLYMMKEVYFQNVTAYLAEAKNAGITVVPAIYPIGYSGSYFHHDANLAAGIPARGVTFLVKNGEARPDPALALPVENGGFEELADERSRFMGWTSQDHPNRYTFADRAEKHSGQFSLKITGLGQLPSGLRSIRLAQPIKVRPFQYYRATIWAKSKDLDGETEDFLVATSSGGQRRNIYTKLGIKPTQDWTKHQICFNTLEAEEINLSVGVTDPAGGTLWLDDLTIEPAGLLLVLRRELCPLTVTSADGGVTYTEGQDFEKIADPVISQDPFPGEFTVDHDAVPIKLTKTSRIKEGDRLSVSYYHPIRIYGDQDVISLQEPKVFDLMDDQAKRVIAAWPTGHYMMNYDEIRVGGWEPDGKNLSPGQILANHVRKGIEIIRKYDPNAKIYTWSDMFTPHHNARPMKTGEKTSGYYYLVNGTWDGAWEGIDKSIAIFNWYAPKKESISFFADRGHEQILCGYYDVKGTGPMQANIASWMKMSAGQPNVSGLMYTTWHNNYKDLPEFFRLVAEYPKWVDRSATAPAKDH